MQICTRLYTSLCGLMPAPTSRTTSAGRMRLRTAASRSDRPTNHSTVTRRIQARAKGRWETAPRLPQPFVAPVQDRPHGTFEAAHVATTRTARVVYVEPNDFVLTCERSVAISPHDERDRVLATVQQITGYGASAPIHPRRQVALVPLRIAIVDG